MPTRRDLLPVLDNGDVRLKIDASHEYSVGSRLCSNPDCRAHLFVVTTLDGHLMTSYPPETIDFDAIGLPNDVVEAFEESVRCHAQQCYVAAAMMVRKTLEAVCADRGAGGANLKARIAALGGKVVLPQALLDGLDDLRLLGNDAAHIDSHEYEQVGQEEVEVAIDVTKEILKASYQYEAIIGRLRGLRRNQEEGQP